jgi:hypothetical protein
MPTFVSKFRAFKGIVKFSGRGPRTFAVDHNEDGCEPGIGRLPKDAPTYERNGATGSELPELTLFEQ